MSQEQYYKQLVQRYLEKKLTDEELEVFAVLLTENKLDEYMLEAMDQDTNLDVFAESNDRKPRRIFLHVARIAAAAVVVLMVGFGLYFYTKDSASEKYAHVGKANVNKQHIAPGGNKAVLTLSNGQKLLLDNEKEGVLAMQNSVNVSKAKDGLVIYDVNNQDANATGLRDDFNVIETPKGGQYQVVLPDGSKAWLNAASRIKFPLRFSAQERKVEVIGEVYFEVRKDKKRPFRVAFHNQVVEVLGTHFNVNAYDDESQMRTTLLEGSVKVTNGTSLRYVVLKPGQQAVVDKVDPSIKVRDADVEATVAWKDGYFHFNRVDIKSMMRQISRWYNIDVEYRGVIPPEEFVGKISRNEDLSQVLRILKIGEVNFRLEGRKIIIEK